MNKFFNSNTITGAGAAFGAYTQDPFGEDSSLFATAAGAAIGGYVTNIMSKDIMDTYERLVPRNLSMDTIAKRRVDVSRATDNSLSMARDSLSKHMERVLDNESSLYGKNLSTVLGGDFSADDAYGTTMGKLEAYSESIKTDRSKTIQLRDILKNESEISLVSSKPIDTKAKNFTPIRPGDELSNIHGKLYDHFKNNLGNTDAQSELKAKGLASALEGRSVNIEDNQMVIKGPSGSRDATFNLTSVNKDGINYTEKNGIKNIVRSMNPLGKLYIDDKSLVTKNGNSAGEFVTSKSVTQKMHPEEFVTSKSVTQKMHPEELIGLLNSVNGSMDHNELLKLSEQLNARALYSSLDSRGSALAALSGIEEANASGIAERISSTLDMGLSLSEDKDGKFRYMNTQTSIKEGELRSPMSQISNKLSLEENYDPKVGQGTSALTLLTAPEDADRLYTPGFHHAEDRGATSVSLRDHAPVHVSDSKYIGARAMHDGRAKTLQRSASHGTRINVSDQMAEMFPEHFGNKFAIDDGHGLFNESKAFKFAARQTQSVTIGNVGDKLNPKYLLSMGVPEDVISGSERDIAKYLTSNDVKVTAGRILGYGKNGEAASLPNHFTSGKLINIVKTQDSLELVFSAKHEPEDWAKIFGTASKSGVTKANELKFAEMGALALAESRGMIELNKNSKGEYRFNLLNRDLDKMPKKQRMNTTFSVSDVVSKMKKTKTGRDLLTEAGGATLMQRWDDVGQQGISDILHGSKEVSSGIVKELKESLKGKNADRLLSKMEALGNSGKDRVEKANIYRTILATSSNKSSQDMFLSMTEHAAINKNSKDLDFLVGLEGKGSGFTDNQMDRLTSIMSKTFKGREGSSYTQFTPNLGEAIHGAGASGSMSWLEYTMLKSTGFDEDVLNQLTESNRGALQELSMVESTWSKGDFDGKSFTPGTDKSQLMERIFKVNSEERRGVLEEHGVKVSSKNTMANYQLVNEVEGVKSIPIGFEDTNYTGLKEFAGKQMLFQTEKARAAVIAADIGLEEAQTKQAKALARETLVSEAKNLNELQGKMMSGDNNLRKEGGKRVAKNSMQLTARPIGGSADRGIKGTPDYSNIINRDTAEEMYRRMGLKLEDHMEDLGDGLFALKDQDMRNLHTLSTREPAQGPFSTHIAELRMDDTLGNRGRHVFIPKSNDLQSAFQFLDYDADHLRILPTFDLSDKQFKALEDDKQRRIKSAKSLLKMQEKLGVKGVSKHLDILSQFKKPENKAFHSLSRKEMAGLRKVDSSDVTRIVSEMNKALDIEGAGKEFFEAERVLAHNLTENLLKSQHKAASSGHRGAVQSLMEAQKDFLRTGGSSEKTFKNRVKNIIDDTLGGQFSSMEPAQRKQYTDAVENLSSIFASKYEGIDKSMETFLGPSRYKDMSSAQVQAAILEYGGMQGGEGPIPSKAAEINTSSVKHSMNKGYNKLMVEVGSLMFRNSGKLAAGVLGLGALAIASRDTPQQLTSTSPIGNEAQPLQPLPDKKGYIRQYNPDRGLSVTASVKTERSNLNRMTLDRALFGDSSDNVSVNITDKSGMF